MLAQCPWLQEFAARVGTRQASGSASSCTKEGAGGEPSAKAPAVESFDDRADDAAIEAAFEELHSKRQALQASAHLQSEDFEFTVLGGGWTALNVGKAVDYCIGKARNSAAERWCRQYCLPMSNRFSIDMYGEANGTLLSRYWTAKMFYYYDVYISSTLRTSM